VLALAAVAGLVKTGGSACPGMEQGGVRHERKRRRDGKGAGWQRLDPERRIEIIAPDIAENGAVVPSRW